ncbi:MAG: hypothetical protein ACTHQQ_16275 [Solirubrobacteraceae bacterium]
MRADIVPGASIPAYELRDHESTPFARLGQNGCSSPKAWLEAMIAP